MEWFTKLDDDAKLWVLYFGLGAVVAVCVTVVKVAQAVYGVSE